MAIIKGITVSVVFAILFATYTHGEDDVDQSDMLYTGLGPEDDEDYRRESAWYKPSVQEPEITDFKRLSSADLHSRRRSMDHARGDIDLFIPTLYGNEKGLDLMLKHAKRANNFIGTCISTGKDYVIAVEDTSSIDKGYWENELHAFVKLFVYALSATRGTNTLSLIKYSSSPEKVLDRSLMNRNDARKLGLVIDQMFAKKSSVPYALPGRALKFMREHVYPNVNHYISTSDTREVSVDQTAGKDTVVIIINSGSVHDSTLALDEAFYARRNGVTFFSLEIGEKSAAFWKQLTGCRRGYKCLYYTPVFRRELFERVGLFLRNVCQPDGRDAVCLEEWSEYTACSQPCGVGIMTSTLKGFKTLISHTAGRSGVTGRTCESQLETIRTKQKLCNLHRCDRPAPRSREEKDLRSVENVSRREPVSPAVIEDGNGTVIDSVLDEVLPVPDMKGPAQETAAGAPLSDMNENMTPSNDGAPGVDIADPTVSEPYDTAETRSPRDSEAESVDVDGDYMNSEFPERRGNHIPDMPNVQPESDPLIDRPGSMEREYGHSRGGSRRSRNVDTEESANQYPFYIKHMGLIMMYTAAFAVVCIIGGGCYTAFSKRRDRVSLVVEESAFLNDTIGGHDESAESYRVAGANDGMWA
ncbi:p18 protein [Babesia divergens]|uniref:P18 protein n=1 Tax=Babesia divergens TaxID=32595 RepID=A0AAD9LJE1_BABDI|nr:p18 protein [Babesia divergens]